MLAATLVLLTGNLRGVVMRGPIAPVCQVGMPCNEPARGAVLVFSLRLAAGTYLVRQPVPPRIGFGIRPGRVRVFAGASTRADFFIDTGIR